MFSPEASVLHDRTATLQSTNPRRRQRTSSSDSLAAGRAQQQQPHKRRKRSALAETAASNSFNLDSAASAADLGVSGSTGQENYAQTNGTAKRASFGIGTTVSAPRRGSNTACSLQDSNLDASSLALRSKASRVGGTTGAGGTAGGKRRTGRGEDGVELAKTETFVLTRDRSIPGALQEIIGSEPWHAKLCADLGYGVIFTASRAIIWRYGHARQISGHDSGTFIIQLPSASAASGSSSRQDVFDNLPVGTLVHDAGAGDLALLAIQSGGKVVYYESIRAAAAVTDNARTKAQVAAPFTGALSGIFSGESVCQISEAEPDGFMLATNTGRLIHLSVRDAQGRPNISTQYLKASNAEAAGLFGSLRNALKFGGPSKEIVNVIPVPGRGRSQKDLIVVTARGAVQLWNVARHGPKTMQCEWDLKPTIVEACQSITPGMTAQAPTILDLALIPAGRDARKAEYAAMAMASFPGGEDGAAYYLVTLILQDGAIGVDQVHQMRSYDGPEMAPSLSGRKFKPRLLVPEPGHTAFVVFDTKIVLVSLTKLEDTPDSQLHVEARDIAENYEECLFFNRKLPYHVVACTVEPADDRSDRAACDIMVHGFGHIRLFANSATPGESQYKRRSVSIRSRLEQVVFYGSMVDNFLDFRNEALWKDVQSSEVDEAVSTIIASILDSTSPYVPSVSPSMELQLKRRGQAVLDLNRFIQRWSLPISSRWRLLWSAEKIAAAAAVYDSYNTSLAGRQPEQKMLLEEVCDMINEQLKHINDPEKGETDVVRHYMTWDVARFGDVVTWAEQAIDELWSEGVQGVEEQAPLISQGNDIILAAMETALKYREDHAEAYGLGKDQVVHQIYQGSYAEMKAEPWTCALRICQRSKMMAELATQMAYKLDNLDDDDLPFKEELINKLANDSPRLLDVDFKAWEERIRWLQASTAKGARQELEMARAEYAETRKGSLSGLINIGLHIPAIELAERYHDMEALAMVTNKIRDQAELMLHDYNPSERHEGLGVMETVLANENRYFDDYGTHWADAYYDRQISVGDSARMLGAFIPARQGFLTNYLRTIKKEDSRVHKLSWINEICGEGRFDTAADDLIDAERQETRLWAKQVQLSLAKLGKLAAIERKQITDEKAGLREARKLDQHLFIARMQQKLYAHVRPILGRAIDEVAELELLVRSYSGYVADMPTLQEQLSRTFEKLVRRQVIEIEPLIDALSLMNPTEEALYGRAEDEEAGFMEQRFFHALYLLHLSRLEKSDPYRARLIETCVWRRCLLQDDWAALNRTEGKSEAVLMEEARSTSLYATLAAGLGSGIWTQHPPRAPRDLHPGGETVVDLRRSSRYERQTDAYLINLAKDHAVEDTMFEEALTKGRLEMWWGGVLEAAKADFEGSGGDVFGPLVALKDSQPAEVEVEVVEERPAQPEPAAQPQIQVVIENGHHHHHHNNHVEDKIEDDEVVEEIVEDTQTMRQDGQPPEAEVEVLEEIVIDQEEPELQPETELGLELEPEPVPEVEAEPILEIEAELEPQPEPEPELKVEPEPQITPKKSKRKGTSKKAKSKKKDAAKDPEGDTVMN